MAIYINLKIGVLGATPLKGNK
jgi:hypothetical protein